MALETHDVSTRGPETEFLEGTIARAHLAESIAPAWFANGESSSDSEASEDSDDGCPIAGSTVIPTDDC